MTVEETALKRMIEQLATLPPESFEEVARFIEFLQFKAGQMPQRVVKLGGLWDGYSFTEEEITAARQEVWATQGDDFDE